VHAAASAANATTPAPHCYYCQIKPLLHNAAAAAAATTSDCCCQCYRSAPHCCHCCYSFKLLLLLLLLLSSLQTAAAAAAAMMSLGWYFPLSTASFTHRRACSSNIFMKNSILFSYATPILLKHFKRAQHQVTQ
jgi:hypothetical protein